MNVTVGPGQVFSGVVSNGDGVYVSGGSASGVTVLSGGHVVVFSGGTAVGTVVAGGGELEVGVSGAASGTTVLYRGIEVVSGVDVGATVHGGGYFTLQGGSATGEYFASGSDPIVAVEDVVQSSEGGDENGVSASSTPYSGTITDVTVQGPTGLAIPATYTLGGRETLTPGSYLDLLGIPYQTGASATYDSAGNTLTIRSGATVSTLQLAGSYSGDTFTVVPFATDQAISVLEVTSGGQADGAFGFQTTPPPVYALPAGIIASADSAPPNTTITNDQEITGLPVFVVSSRMQYSSQVLATVSSTIMAAGRGGLFPGVYSAPLDGAGNQAIYSTIDSAGHAITANGTGQSLIVAGSGRDTVTVSNGTDGIVTGSGASTVNLASGSNIVESGGNDTINVGSGADTIGIDGSSIINTGAARLSVYLPSIATGHTANLGLHIGTGSVTVLGGAGSGGFSGGTAGHNLLIAGTGVTTLYAGGDGDLLEASGGQGTTLNGWGGNERLLGEFGAGPLTFNFNSANVSASTGTGQNVVNVGTGNNVIDLSRGSAMLNFTSGAAGKGTYLAYFNGNDHVHLTGYAADEVSHALGTATIYQGSEVLHLRDGTSIAFGSITGLTTSSFV